MYSKAYDIRSHTKIRTATKVTKKRIKEITIIQYKRRQIKSYPSMMPEACPICGGVDFVTIATAAELTGISRSALYDWVSRNKVHAVRLSHGQIRVCCQSLSEQIRSIRTNS